jgi:hypothetical protein
MHAPTHALIGWVVANTADIPRRDRFLVLLAGVVADADALIIVLGKRYYQTYHHMISHNALSTAIFTLLILALARRRWVTTGLGFLSFNLHLLCDLLGSGGPYGGIWPVYYLWPFSDWPYYFPYQWGLASWQNVTVTIMALLVSFHIAAVKGRTPIEFLSLRADEAVVAAIRRRWPFGGKSSRETGDEAGR